MAGRTWQYKGEVDEVAVTHVWRVIGFIVGMSTLAIVTGFVMPHDRPTDWSWVLIGLGIVVALLAVLGVVALRTVRQGTGATPSPAVAFTIALGFLVALVPLTVGLSGAHALYRCILFSPAMVVGTFGGRRMVAIFGALTLVALGVASIAQGLPPEALPSLLLSYGLGWGAVLVIVHLNHEDTVVDLDHQKWLAELSAIVATATTLDHGLQAMAPTLGDLLDADAVEIRRVGPGLPPGGEVAAGWTRPGSTIEPEAPVDLDVVHGALELHAPAIDQHHIRFGVAGDTDLTAPLIVPIGLVVLIRRQATRHEARMTVRHRAEQARASLATLLRRLDVLDRLEARSTTDSLTELANRRALFDRLVREREGARRDGRSLVVAMIDVDHFKDFNDAFGHLAGDAVLVDLARLFEQRIRATDLAARFGGEEFCLVLPGTTATEAERVVATLHDACRRIAAARPITFSAGIAQWAPDEQVDDLLARADSALYAAKAAGRDRTVIAPPTLVARDERATERSTFRTL